MTRSLSDPRVDPQGRYLIEYSVETMPLHLAGNDEGGTWQEPDVEALAIRDLGVAVALMPLLEPDVGTCAAEGCGQSVGYVLHEDDDNPSGGGLVWRWTTFLSNGKGKVIAVCEECRPDNLYGGLW